MSMADDFIDVFYGDGRFTNFGAELFRLIGKADSFNLERIERGFPAEVKLYRWWAIRPTIPASDTVRTKAEEIDSKARGTIGR